MLAWLDWLPQLNKTDRDSQWLLISLIEERCETNPSSEWFNLMLWGINDKGENTNNTWVRILRTDLKDVAAALQLFYDNDLLDEDLILVWHDKGMSQLIALADQKASEETRRAAGKFAEWLKFVLLSSLPLAQCFFFSPRFMRNFYWEKFCLVYLYQECRGRKWGGRWWVVLFPWFDLHNPSYSSLIFCPTRKLPVFCVWFFFEFTTIVFVLSVTSLTLSFDYCCCSRCGKYLTSSQSQHSFFVYI